MTAKQTIIAQCSGQHSVIRNGKSLMDLRYYFLGLLPQKVSFSKLSVSGFLKLYELSGFVARLVELQNWGNPNIRHCALKTFLNFLLILGSLGKKQMRFLSDC